MNCSYITRFMDDVKSGTLNACKEIKALIDHVEYCFENEDIYVDEEQIEKYLSLGKYFTYETIFPWQAFVIGLHDCTYWERIGNAPVAGSAVRPWKRGRQGWDNRS